MSTARKEQDEPLMEPPGEPQECANPGASPEAGIPATDPLPSMIVCWRCGLSPESQVRCIHCEAVLEAGGKKKNSGSASQDRSPSVLRLILAYFIMLCVSLGWSMFIHSSRNISDSQHDAGIIIVECLDLLITLSLFIFLGRIRLPSPGERIRVLCWFIAPCVSLVLYLLTHWYVESIRRYVNLDWLRRESNMHFTLFYVIIVAVQPAIVEELFFRYFAYGTLRKLTNVHAAVVLSALMFALAHLYNPLGMPMLFVMGIVLGYARAGSGGVLLPMLMHFAHNFTVLYLGSQR
ncbi:MAG: CPBP family intramembrane metalloprotease [Gemmatales bacterium]